MALGTFGKNHKPTPRPEEPNVRPPEPGGRFDNTAAAQSALAGSKLKTLPMPKPASVTATDAVAPPSPLEAVNTSASTSEPEAPPSISAQPGGNLSDKRRR